MPRQTRDVQCKHAVSNNGTHSELTASARAFISKDVTRARYGINRAYPLNYAEESLALLEQLKSYPDSVTAH